MQQFPALDYRILPFVVALLTIHLSPALLYAQSAQKTQTAKSPTLHAEEVSSMAAQVNAIRQSAATPEEAIRKTAELLKTSLRPIWVGKGTDMVSLASLPAPVENLPEDDRLRIEVRNALLETRASAKTPQEQIKLVDEFLHLNAGTLASLRPPKSTAAGFAAARQAMLASLKTRADANPGDLQAQAAVVLFEVRQQARSPQEMISRTDEFLRLNRQTLTDYERQQRQTAPSEEPNQPRQ